MLYLASKSDMSFWDGALSPLILTLSWKQTFHVCKENEEEEDEGSPDFQDVACILSCMMAAAQDYRVWGVFCSLLFWFFLHLQYTAEKSAGMQPQGQYVLKMTWKKMRSNKKREGS